MPSDKILSQKKESVQSIAEALKTSPAGVIVDYKGISVLNDTKLRRELREAGVSYKVVKNTLLRFAFKDAGIDGMEESLSGTTAIAISQDDPVVAAKLLGKYAEGSKGAFSIKSGYMDGKAMTGDQVVALGKLPGKEQLLSMVCSALQGNIRGLAVALNRVVEKSGEAAT